MLIAKYRAGEHRDHVEMVVIAGRRIGIRVKLFYAQHGTAKVGVEILEEGQPVRKNTCQTPPESL